MSTHVWHWFGTRRYSLRSFFLERNCKRREFNNFYELLSKIGILSCHINVFNKLFTFTEHLYVSNVCIPDFNQIRYRNNYFTCLLWMNICKHRLEYLSDINRSFHSPVSRFCINENCYGKCNMLKRRRLGKLFLYAIIWVSCFRWWLGVDIARAFCHQFYVFDYIWFKVVYYNYTLSSWLQTVKTTHLYTTKM